MPTGSHWVARSVLYSRTIHACCSLISPCEERFEEPAVRQLREEQTMALTQESVAKEPKALQNPNLLLAVEYVTSIMHKFLCFGSMTNNP